jgi:hypothetical protein
VKKKTPSLKIERLGEAKPRATRKPKADNAEAQVAA